MIKKTYWILIVFLLLLLPLSILKISANAKEDCSPIFSFSTNEEKPIGNLIIEKLNLDENIYELGSPKNNVEEHVTILNGSTYPDIDRSTLILAAHSGVGKIAYFEELDNLKVNDTIDLVFKGKKYTYYVRDIWEEKKNGYINISEEDTKQLILTTCSPNRYGYQLIINCIEKESN